MNAKTFDPEELAYLATLLETKGNANVGQGREACASYLRTQAARARREGFADTGLALEAAANVTAKACFDVASRIVAGLRAGVC